MAKCPKCSSEMRLYYAIFRDLQDARTGSIYYCNKCKCKYEKVIGSNNFIFDEFRSKL